MLTLFTWGYWGWGNSTRELVRRIDAAEKKSGFDAPVFVDIRVQRAVRAEGFNGSAFEQVAGPERYWWLPSLGNRNVKANKPGIRIADPYSARTLLDLAIHYERQNRRIYFFCACKEFRWCHRKKVANLVRKEAGRRHRRIRILEWPGIDLMLAHNGWIGSCPSQVVDARRSLWRAIKLADSNNMTAAFSTSQR